MKVLSYNWPREYVELHPGVITEPWDMDSVGIVAVLPVQGTDEQKRVWRERGKIILHTIRPGPLWENPGALKDAMLEVCVGECDGVSLDEILLGRMLKAGLREFKLACQAFRSERPGKIIHTWIGCALSAVDPKTVNTVYRWSNWVSPEIYLRENRPLTFEDFFLRYKIKASRRKKTLLGIATHAGPEYRITDAGWLPNMERQIAEIRRLKVGGVAMWAPTHLKNSGERKQLDELLK